jgi:hypothetical protein
MFSRLKEIRVPTLVIQIAREQAIDPRTVTGIAGAIPGSQFVSIDSSNHILLEDEPGWQEFKSGRVLACAGNSAGEGSGAVGSTTSAATPPLTRARPGTPGTGRPAARCRTPLPSRLRPTPE